MLNYNDFKSWFVNSYGNDKFDNVINQLHKIIGIALIAGKDTVEPRS